MLHTQEERKNGRLSQILNEALEDNNLARKEIAKVRVQER